MNTGYGHGLLAAEWPWLLVSFEEFSKKPDQQLAVTTMAGEYDPKKLKPVEVRNDRITAATHDPS